MNQICKNIYEAISEDKKKCEHFKITHYSNYVVLHKLTLVTSFIVNWSFKHASFTDLAMCLPWINRAINRKQFMYLYPLETSLMQTTLWGTRRAFIYET